MENRAFNYESAVSRLRCAEFLGTAKDNATPMEPNADSTQISRFDLWKELRRFRSELLGKIKDMEENVSSLRENSRTLNKEITSSHEATVDGGPLLNREEAAELLNISVRTLDDMADAGEIQPVQIRGRVLYAPDTLEAFIRRRAEGE